MKAQDMNLICNLDVLKDREREQFSSLTGSLLSAVRERRELASGFAFRFDNKPGGLVQIAEFIERESRCCSFLGFKLEVEPEGGPAWLYITGPEGTKPFLLAELEQSRSKGQR